MEGFSIRYVIDVCMGLHDETFSALFKDFCPLFLCMCVVLGVGVGVVVVVVVVGGGGGVCVCRSYGRGLNLQPLDFRPYSCNRGSWILQLMNRCLE